MKKNLIAIVSTAFILASCAGGVVEKRKHRTGFHWNGINKGRPSYSASESSTDNGTSSIAKQELEAKKENNNSVAESRERRTELAEGIKVPAEENSFKNGDEQFREEVCAVDLPTLDKPQSRDENNLPVEESIFSDSEEKHRNRNTFALFTVLAAIGAAALWFKKKDKKLGAWALENRRKTKWILAGLQTGLAADAYFLGRDLAASGIEFNYNGGALALGGLATITGISLLNKKGQRKWGRNRALLAAGPLLLAAAYLNPVSPELVSKNSSSKVISHLAVAPNYSERKVVGTSEAITEETDKDGVPQKKGLKNVQKMLMIMAAVVAIIGIAILSCALSCAGYTYLPIALLLFGIGSVVVLLISGIRYIKGAKVKEKPSFGKVAMYILLGLGFLALLLYYAFLFGGNLLDFPYLG